MEFIAIFVYIGISYLVADKIGKTKKIGFTKCFVVCMLASPFIGYLIAEGLALKIPEAVSGVTMLKTKQSTAAFAEKMKRGTWENTAKNKLDRMNINLTGLACIY